MTGCTFGIVMLAKQREARQAMVEEYVFSPRFFVVAVPADIPLGTLVRVVVLMTVPAISLELSFKHRFDMAGRTFNVGVCTAKGVSGIDVVIERKLHPLSGNVAGVTILAKVSVVIVIVAVAGEACRGQLIGKRVVAMAVVASKRRVPAS